MTDLTPVSSTNPFANAPASAPASVADGLGADTFLQLLVAQLKYQDPTSPAEGTDFLAQTAQFTMVEKLTQLAEQAEASAVVNANLGAASMVGRTVTWLQGDGTIAEGVVTRARLGSTGPVLTVGDAEVPFDRVSSVVHTPPAPAPSADGATPPAATDPSDDGTTA